MSKLVIGIAITAVVVTAHYAFADTVYLETKPSSSISAKEAVKAMSTGGSAWKCDLQAISDSLNPKKVKGSKSSFHSAVGKGIDAPGKLFADGKRLYKCEEMELNEENGRARKK